MSGRLAAGLEVLLTARFDSVSRVLDAIDTTSLFTTEPLRARLIDALGGPVVPPTDLRLAINAVDMRNGQIVRFVNHAPDLHLDSEESEYVHGPISVDMILASAAIPILFNPVRVNGRDLWDGGLLVNTPLAPTIALGATHIIPVLVTAGRHGVTSARFSLGDAIERLADAFLENAYNTDRKLLLERNRLARPPARARLRRPARRRHRPQAAPRSRRRTATLQRWSTLLIPSGLRATPRPASSVLDVPPVRLRPPPWPRRRARRPLGINLVDHRCIDTRARPSGPAPGGGRCEVDAVRHRRDLGARPWYAVLTMRHALPLAVLLLAVAACGDSTSTPTADSADAVSVDTTPGVLDDALADAADAGPDDSAAPDTLEADTTPPRGYSFRAIGGMSMGAAAITIALEHAGDFDFVGALGGYADTTYMMAQMLRLHLGGFCPLADLSGRLDALDDPAADPPVMCGPGLTRSPLEVAQDFDHLAYDDNGITMTRGFYGDVIENFSAAYGNLALPATAAFPSLPAGVDPAWYFSTPEATRCAAPQPVAARYSFNAEYNPEGLYPVIPLCDINVPLDPALPDSWFDPAAPRNRAISPLLAVDLNANGRRDYGEPLMLNPWERYRDVGLDGCTDAYEDGLGGCLATAATLAPGADPNGDRYDWELHPGGLEANDAYDVGEPFDDLGLDGVAAAVAGFADEGEGNGTWDAVDALATLLEHDADTRIRALDAAALDTMDFWLDGGIRDVLHAGVAARNLVAALRSRGRTVSVFHNFAGRPDALAPDTDDYALIGEVFALDLSAAALGRDVYIEYGDPNASAAEIADGDGKHVGRSIDALNRLITFLVAAMFRWPDPDLEAADLPSPAARQETYYSAGLGARRGYTLGLPPGYHKPENANKRYPVIYFLHGLGQDARDLGAAAAATSLLMSEGRVPKAIFVFPDGGCCFRDSETMQRECACGESHGGVKSCVDPSCTGPSDTCAVRDIPDGRLQRECVKGSLYANMRSNLWGEAREDLGYRTSVDDLVKHVDATWRTRPPTR